jgi:hypothetical protein
MFQEHLGIAGSEEQETNFLYRTIEPEKGTGDFYLL